ncbi:MAG: DUF1501 domain-containing protein [Planctomycetota bacterium]|nr:DUF1501 domain-containing protein [Planctomycetota bacterium]MDA1211327.1 DUF1501 domain-containing protein [Planctomycetota bacterium]
MLTIFGKHRQFCDGVSRRDFLAIGGLGALTLPRLLQAGEASKRHKSVINVWLPGGPSHMDTYDPKPEAPAEYRGEFKAISSNVPGMDFCEHLPRHAAIADQLVLVRAVVGAVLEHAPALLMSGYGEAAGRAQGGRPGVGAILSKIEGPADPRVPPYVSLMGNRPGLDAGYVGSAHDPFTPDGPGMQNLSLNNSISLDRLDNRRALLSGFDNFRNEADRSGLMSGMDAFAARAFEMIVSPKTRDALDINREDPRTRERYGDATQFLTARRLVEAGVRCVTLAIGGWDTHGNNFGHLRGQLPSVDRAIATLIDDLRLRGLDQDCSVVVWGEFGRTPRVNANAGRDHWEPVMSALVAGGGLKMGQVIGSTNARGEVAQDRPITVQQVLATLYHGLGVDPATTLTNASGRPMYLLDDREPISELI